MNNKLLFLALLLFVSSSVVFADAVSTSPYGVIDLEAAIDELPESSKEIIHDKRLLDG